MKRQQAQLDYQNSLTKQIKTDKQRKKYGDLMTEHERRVHDKQIKAYEKYQHEGLEQNGVPQLGQHYMKMSQKYMEKAFGNSPQSRTPIEQTTPLRARNNEEQFEATPKPLHHSKISMTSLTGALGNSEKKKAPSQLAMAGSMNILSTKGVGP